MILTKKAQIQFLILRSIGNFLLLFGLFGVGMTFGPAVYEEVHYRIDQATGVKYTVSEPSNGFSQASAFAQERVLSPKDPFFSIIIPKIGASAAVIPNVDSTNEGEYVKDLQKGIAHAKGTVFPDLPGTTYLFAHSTDSIFNVGRYNAVFYLLKNLTIGDQIILFFKDKRYNYTVTDTKIIKPNDVDLLVNAQKSTTQLVLQTCWPPGTTLERFIVIAKPSGNL